MRADVDRPQRGDAEREAGRGWSAIAADLTTEGVPTARGGAKWYPSTVQAVWNGQDATKHRADATA